MRLAEALRESEERFRALFEASPWGALIHDEGRILDANSTLAMIFGYEASELIGMDAPDLVAPECRDFTLQKRLAGCEEPYEAVALRRDGTTFPFELCGRAVRWDGRAVRMVAVRDLTERKRAEEALRENEGIYRDLYEAAPIAYFSVGVDARVLRCNRKAQELLGYTSEQLAGMRVLDLYSDAPDGKERARSVLRRFQAGEPATNEQLEMRRADGEPIWISLSVTPIRDAVGNVVASRNIWASSVGFKNSRVSIVVSSRLRLALGAGRVVVR